MPEDPARNAVRTGVLVQMELGPGVSKEMWVPPQPGVGPHCRFNLLGKRVGVLSSATFSWKKRRIRIAA
jgi:hypothetical protein